MAHLDRTEPYAVVYSSDNGCYRISQDGKLFHPNGTEIGHEDESAPEAPIDVLGGDAIPDATTIDNMHWSELKALIESYGGEWVDKQSAVEFLRGMLT